MDHDAVLAEEFLDEVRVVVEVRGDEHEVVLVLPAQQLVQERRLLDAFLVKVRFEAVVGKCDDFVGACGNESSEIC